MNIEIWTDGATSKNGTAEAAGGYGFVIFFENDENPYYCYGPVTGDKVTNNVCELSAVMLALNLLEVTGIGRNHHITVYTDSAYIANCFKDKWYVNWEANGWVNSKKKPVENRGLWEQILLLYRAMDVEIVKTKGHANDKYNNLVDELARKGAKGLAYETEKSNNNGIPLITSVIEKLKSIFVRS